MQPKVDSAEVQAAIDYAIQLMEEMKAKKRSEEAAKAEAREAAVPEPKGPPVFEKRISCQPDVGVQDGFAYTQNDVEHVGRAFSRTAALGLRSLPNALHPDFRMHLYGALVVMAKVRRGAAKASSDARPSAISEQALQLAAALANSMAHSTKGPPLQTEVAAGQTAPGVYSAMRHIFTLYEHGHSDINAYKDAVAEYRREMDSRKLYGDFIVTALPQAPKGSTLFEEFTYMEDPYDLKVEARRASQAKDIRQRMGGRYVTSGRPKPSDLAMSSLDDCLLRLHARLSADWPMSFVQVFEDIPGNIVIAFHRDLAAHEGDITTYMNQHYRTDITVQNFKLIKDTNQWGVMTEAQEEYGWGVFYVYWPPWAARPKIVPPHLAGPRPKFDPNVVAGPSTRTPFGQRTDAGLLTNYNTRVAECTMRFGGPSLL